MGKFPEEFSARQLSRVLGFATPTDEQAAVAEYPPLVEAEGKDQPAPLLVVAGAGSGKTETLSLRAVYMNYRYGVPGQNILGLTFTRKAAGELSTRLRQRLETLKKAQLGSKRFEVEPFAFLLDSPEATTYNAFALSIVQEFGASVGITPSVEHLGEAAAWQLMSEVVAGWTGRISGNFTEATTVDKALELRQEIAGQAMTVEEARRSIRRLTARFQDLQRDNPRSFTADFKAALETLELRLDLLNIVEVFEERKQSLGRMDYADQVLAAIRIVEENAEVKRILRERHQVVFLDEFQDTSVGQMRFLSALFHDHPVTAVGDPNQAIYGWRGASAASLSDFHPRFTKNKGVPWEVKGLLTAWRNSRTILEVANRIAEPLSDPREGSVGGILLPAERAQDGLVKATYTLDAGASVAQIVDYVDEYRTDFSKEFPDKSPRVAVLARTNRPLFPIVEALRERGIPAQLLGGDALLRHPVIMDLRSALEITQNVGRSSDLTRLLTNLDLSAGDLSALGVYARRAARSVDSEGQVPPILLEAVQAAAEKGRIPGLSTEGSWRVKRLGDQLAALRRGVGGSLVSQVEDARRVLSLDLEGMANPTGTDVSDVLDLFTGVVADYQESVDRPTMSAFLTWLEAAENKEGGIRVPAVAVTPGAVHVLTIHAAKGLEWDAVVVAEMESGRLPSNRAWGYRVLEKDPEVLGPPHSPAPQFGWWKDSGKLPYPCREDRAHLPDPNIWDASEPGGSRVALFKEEVGKYLEEEERRLAYVAVTRAERFLLLTGSWFGQGTTPRFPSLFWEEAASVEGSDGKRRVEASSVALPPRHEWTSVGSDSSGAMFPRDPGLVRRRRHQAAMRVSEGVADIQQITQARQREEVLAGLADRDLADRTRALLEAEDREEASRRAWEDMTDTQVLLLAAQERVLNVTELAGFAADKEEGARNLIRPLPAKPATDALIGEVFHEWVEEYLGRLSVSGAEVDPLETQFAGPLGESDMEYLRSLTRVFSAEVPHGEWPVIGLEVPFVTQVGDYVVRGRIDAVFDAGEGRTVLVDWKTRRVPVTKVDPQRVSYYLQQLSAYISAWQERLTEAESVNAELVFVSPRGAQRVSYEQLEAADAQGGGLTLGE